MDVRHWDARHWDELYSSRDQLFSGNPNGVLVAEVADLPPGQALDVGCGEGADALWLAHRGWQVTAIDISEVALRRAATAAAAAGLAERVAWMRADLAATSPPAGAFELVSVQYFPLPRGDGDAVLRGLLAAVAPGGTLLVVFHDPADMPAEHRQHVDLGHYYLPADVAEMLGDGWTVLVNETRPRTAPAPPGTEHVRDVVLRAERLR